MTLRSPGSLIVIVLFASASECCGGDGAMYTTGIYESSECDTKDAVIYNDKKTAPLVNADRGATLNSSEASIVVQHLGATDPTSEGWILQAHNAVGRPVAGDLGYVDAWEVETITGGAELNYRHILSPPTLSQALSSGWVLTAVIRAISGNVDGQLIRFSTGQHIYQVKIRVQANGALVVGLKWGQEWTMPGSFRSYHVIVLSDVNADGFVELSVDGALLTDVFAPPLDAYDARVDFGDNVGGVPTANAIVRYALVRFETGPFSGRLVCEPTGSDCNTNGTADVCDLLLGGSSDCDFDAVPDSCGQLARTFDAESGVLIPIDRDHTQQFSVLSAPTAIEPVALRLTACADLSSPAEHIVVVVNGSYVASAFINGTDCDGTGTPNHEELAIPQAVWNQVQPNGTVEVEFIPDSSLDPRPQSYIRASLSYEFAPATDCDGNGILDGCEVAANDCNSNATVDECELGYADCNSNETLDLCDVSMSALDCTTNQTVDSCELQVNGGSAYIGSRQGDTVYQLDAMMGQVVRSIPLAPIDDVSGVAFSPLGQLTVGTRSVNQVLEIDPDSGIIIRTLITAGSGGSLSQPSGLVYGPNGMLYVSSFGNNKVNEYDAASGAYQRSLTAGGMLGPTGLCIDSLGRLVVCFETSDRIVAFDLVTGLVADVFDATAALDAPQHCVMGPNGWLYASSFQTDLILRFDVATGAYSASLPAIAGLNGPHGLAIGPNGHLFVVARLSNAVYEYDLATGLLVDRQPSTPGIIDPYASSALLQRPTYLAFRDGLSDCDGNGVPDLCELTSGDADGNGALDACELAGDFDGDGIIGTSDIFAFVDVLLRLDLNPSHIVRADLNGDDLADGDDIGPFLAATIP